MLSVDINTKSSTVHCLLPLLYREQMSQPHGRDSWALKTEQRTMFPTEIKAGALRCDSTGSVWGFLPAQCHLWAVRLLSGERQEALSLTPGQCTAAQGGPSFSHPSRPARNHPWSCLQELKWEGQKQNILGMFTFYGLKYFRERERLGNSINFFFPKDLD